MIPAGRLYALVVTNQRMCKIEYEFYLMFSNNCALILSEGNMSAHLQLGFLFQINSVEPVSTAGVPSVTFHSPFQQT